MSENSRVACGNISLLLVHLALEMSRELDPTGGETDRFDVGAWMGWKDGFLHALALWCGEGRTGNPHFHAQLLSVTLNYNLLKYVFFFSSALVYLL